MKTLAKRMARLETAVRVAAPAMCSCCGGPDVPWHGRILDKCAVMPDFDNPEMGYVFCNLCARVVHGRVQRLDDGNSTLVGAVPSQIPYI